MWTAAGGGDSCIVYWRSLRPAWFWVDKREQGSDWEEIPFIRLTRLQESHRKRRNLKRYSTAESYGHRGTASSPDSPTIHMPFKLSGTDRITPALQLWDLRTTACGGCVTGGKHWLYVSSFFVVARESLSQLPGWLLWQTGNTCRPLSEIQTVGN